MKFFAHYRGFWQFGIEFVLAVGPRDIKFVSLQARSIIFEYKYDHIDLIRIELEDNLLTIQLKDTTPSQQKTFMFECLDVEDLANLLQAYTPKHCTADQVRQQENACKLVSLEYCIQVIYHHFNFLLISIHIFYNLSRKVTSIGCLR